MGNLIRAEFYRLRRRPHSVLGMALILLLGVSLLTVSCALPPQVGSAATLLQSISTLSVSGMFFAVWCAAAASSGVNKLDILKHFTQIPFFTLPFHISYLNIPFILLCSLPLRGKI